MVSSTGMITAGGSPLTSLFVAPSLVRPYPTTWRDCRGAFAPNHVPVKSVATTAFKIPPLPSHGMRSTRRSIRMQSEEEAAGDSDMLQGANLGLIRSSGIEGSIRDLFRIMRTWRTGSCLHDSVELESLAWCYRLS